MIRTVLRFFSVCLLFIACGKPGIKEDEISVQPDIVNNPIYTKLDKQGEPVDEIGWDTSKLKSRTTDLFYDNDNKPFVDTTNARKNRCWAYIDSGILKINIGYSYGFGATGFDIICTNNNYNIVPYQTTDQPGKAKNNPTYQIIKQKLILNKSRYMVGDSIFGYVNFQLIENKNTRYNDGKVDSIIYQKITHIGKGYFRGKVEKQFN